MQVWEAFAAAAQTDSALTAVRDETDRTLFEHFRSFVEAAHRAGFLRPGASVDIEAMRLHALADGLASHGVDNPERTNPEVISQVLDAHFVTLLR
jgi:hypothetical protein